MKKTITSALLTLALVGFANAAPPAATKPESVPVKVETIESLKVRVAALTSEVTVLQRANRVVKAENTSLRQKVALLMRSRAQSPATQKQQIAAAYLKEFDVNKDGRVTRDENPDRNRRNAFYNKMHKKNYPHLYGEDGALKGYGPKGLGKYHPYAVEKKKSK